MKTPYADKNDAELCFMFYCFCKKNVNEVKYVGSQFLNKTPTWADKLQYSALGLLFLEIDSRDISPDYYRLIISHFVMF